MFRNRWYHRGSWENPFRSPSVNVPRYSSGKFVAFALGGSLAAYGIAMVIDVERDKKRRSQWLSMTRSRLFKSTNDGTLMRGRSSSNPLVQSWKSLKESQRTMLGLIAINSAVFLAWRMPPLQRILRLYFMQSTTSHPITMLTSVFSHESFGHFGFNMLALWSFGQLLHDRIGREHFLALYTTCGLSASLGSHFYKIWRRDPVKSLGASGALFGIAGACAHIPSVSVSLVFLPFHSFSLEKVLPIMMLFDAVGLVQNWKIFDHAAHLSGALFGYTFYPVSSQYLWSSRHHILQTLNYPIR